MVGRILIAFCLCLTISLSAQEDDEMLWTPDWKLKWSDFKGKVPSGVENAATTASGISYNYAANLLHHEVKLDFEVNTYFYPYRSWYKPEVCNDLILSHEQLHFDISELYARKFRLRLKNTVFTENVKQEVREIYVEILKELGAFQEQYDLETDFSRNREQQLLWGERIAEALQRTSDAGN